MLGVANTFHQKEQILETLPVALTKLRQKEQFYFQDLIGVGGEQVSNTNTRKPLFPIQSVAEDSTGLSETDSQSTLDLPPPPPRMRHLIACEEEGESDEVIVDGMRSQSPLPSPWSRRLLSAHSSPNLAKSVSRSDFSDEEDDDDIMDLSTVPRSHPTHPSPLASPHLSYSRLSPTHSQGYSSDEESLSHTLLYDGRRKCSSKRIRYNKALHPLGLGVRVAVFFLERPQSFYEPPSYVRSPQGWFRV
uniref:Uncharacterized protein n=1 Tax=Amphimedon queenslandica TaxID=400682 RepID=A0A1X7TDL8_AMPQE